MTDDEPAEPVDNDERRVHDRSRLIVDVHFDGGESTGVASSKDISLGGLYMSTRTEIPVGAMLALRIPLASDHVVVKGEVIYTNPGKGVGVKFRDISDDARKSLEQELPQA
jgi:PilZ domain-containing protein